MSALVYFCCCCCGGDGGCESCGYDGNSGGDSGGVFVFGDSGRSRQ